MKTFNELINEGFSGGNVTKMPVIGHIVTKELKYSIGDNSPSVFPSEKLDVVEVLDEPNGKIYIINKWYKSGVPQLVHEEMVKSYTPVKVDEGLKIGRTVQPYKPGEEVVILAGPAKNKKGKVKAYGDFNLTVTVMVNGKPVQVLIDDVEKSGWFN